MSSGEMSGDRPVILGDLGIGDSMSSFSGGGEVDKNGHIDPIDPLGLAESTVLHAGNIYDDSPERPFTTESGKFVLEQDIDSLALLVNAASLRPTLGTDDELWHYR